MANRRCVFCIVVVLLVLSGCRAAADESGAPEPAATAGASPEATDAALPTAESAAESTATAEGVEAPVRPTATEEAMMETPSSPDGPEQEQEQEQLQQLPQVEVAMADLAQRLGVAADAIDVVEVEAVTWPDGSLGCPQPDMAYTQVPQDGLRIRLRAGGETYAYHSGGGREPFLCEQQVGASPTQKSTPVFGEDILTRPGSDED